LGIRKVRVEVEDDKGNKYSFTLNHPINREKVAQFIDLVEMMSGPQERAGFEPASGASKSKFERLLDLIRERFPLTWFSSAELQIAYEEKFGEPISLSTISTYLSRYYDRGILLREGPANMFRYRLKVEAFTGSSKP